MPPDDASLLLDMLVAARQARKHVEGLSLPQYYADEVRHDAVIYQVQIIGEAASRVSAVFQDQHPEIPWVDIIGMRHRLVHDYRGVNRDIVWSTVQDALPQLIATLEGLVPPEPEE